MRREGETGGEVGETETDRATQRGRQVGGGRRRGRQMGEMKTGGRRRRQMRERETHENTLQLRRRGRQMGEMETGGRRRRGRQMGRWRQMGETESETDGGDGEGDRWGRRRQVGGDGEGDRFGR